MKPTVAILTNFMEFNPGYSLTGIVVDQTLMLAREGHKVIIYVNESYNPKYEEDSGMKKVKEKFPDLVKIKQLTKFMHLIDYSTKKDITEKHIYKGTDAANIYKKDFIEEKINIVFTHDFVFTGWNVPYAEAIKIVNKNLPELFWYHWVHSVPSGNRDWWNLNDYGENHFIVFPNKTEIMRVAESFLTTADRVKIIPHIKDIRTWYDFGNDAFELTELYPNIMSADIIQIYPCSTDRLSAKQLKVVIRLFSHMKIIGKTNVFLVAANQWATGRQRIEDVNEYIKFAESYGLIYGKDFIFTSEIKEELETGISKKMLRELQLLSNLFVFPTIEESFGLVGPEAAFSGALPIINRSLTMMFEVMSTHPAAFDFGSFHQNTPAVGNDEYIGAVGNAILQQLYSNSAGMTKTFCRKRYNMDNIYAKYYLPLC